MTSRETDTQIVRQVTDVVQTGLPLGAGLRALAEEAPSRRMRRFFASASQRLEAGDSIASVFSERTNRVPAPLLRLLQSGAESGRVALVLEEYVWQMRSAAARRRRVLISVLYPVVLILTACGVFTFFALELIPEFADIMADFGTSLPTATEILFSASEIWVRFGGYMVFGLVVFVLCGWSVLRLMGGSALVRRLICAIPLFGSMLRESALSAFCRMLALLIENGVPLPEAIQLAGAAARDADLESACRQLSANVERGVSLQEGATTIRQFPPLLLQVFRWEQRRDALIDSLRAAGEVFDSRGQIAGTTLFSVLEPMTVLGVAVSIGLLAFLLFLPILQLLRDLT